MALKVNGWQFEWSWQYSNYTISLNRKRHDNLSSSWDFVLSNFPFLAIVTMPWQFMCRFCKCFKTGKFVVILFITFSFINFKEIVSKWHKRSNFSFVTKFHFLLNLSFYYFYTLFITFSCCNLIWFNAPNTPERNFRNYFTINKMFCISDHVWDWRLPNISVMHVQISSHSTIWSKKMTWMKVYELLSNTKSEK